VDQASEVKNVKSFGALPNDLERRQKVWRVGRFQSFAQRFAFRVFRNDEERPVFLDPGLVNVCQVRMKEGARELRLRQKSFAVNVVRWKNSDDTGCAALRVSGAVGLAMRIRFKQELQTVASDHFGTAAADFGETRMIFVLTAANRIIVAM